MKRAMAVAAACLLILVACVCEQSAACAEAPVREGACIRRFVAPNAREELGAQLVRRAHKPLPRQPLVRAALARMETNVAPRVSEGFSGYDAPKYSRLMPSALGLRAHPRQAPPV